MPLNQIEALQKCQATSRQIMRRYALAWREMSAAGCRGRAKSNLREAVRMRATAQSIAVDIQDLQSCAA